MKIRVMLVDDHEPTRQHMTALIEREADMKVVAEASNGEDSMAKVLEVSPDVIVMDILLPGMNGVDTSRRIVSLWPSARIVVLSNHSGQALVQAVLDAGALGYVRKDLAFEELIPAIRAVAAGEEYLGEKILNP
ncbi:MAG: response regulator transcription factor [Kiritimatiellae bacterium]|nr:response regulator transcription factor [Kiritimatiellia bacterium]